MVTKWRHAVVLSKVWTWSERENWASFLPWPSQHRNHSPRVNRQVQGVWPRSWPLRRYHSRVEARRGRRVPQPGSRQSGVQGYDRIKTNRSRERTIQQLHTANKNVFAWSAKYARDWSLCDVRTCILKYICMFTFIFEIFLLNFIHVSKIYDTSFLIAWHVAFVSCLW